ncbi:MAG: hypothetical protein K9J25_11595 [Bacteroidales bacterium]|nr:hypothetical protein [Bacteroidales bacterium]
MNKTAIYIAIIIFLLVTNVATIVTIVANNSNEEENSDNRPVIEMPRDRRMGFFHNQIGIRDDQRPAFLKYNMRFSEKAGQLNYRMVQLRHRMVEEMASENPDTVLLKKIASDFGNLHEEMKILTMEYYFNLKSVSDETQRERLHFLFRDMLDPEGHIYGRGRGGAGRGLRRGGGRLQRDINN